MKIYIVSIPPSLLQNKLQVLIDLFGLYSEKKKYELCSPDFGLHIIEKDEIYRIETTFKTDYELIKGYNCSKTNYDLLVDKTIYTNIPVVSQLPVNYISSLFHEMQFKINKKSKLSLIIECLEETQNYEKMLVPVNFYLNYDEPKLDLNDHFFQEEFNMFLSKLN